MTLSKLEILRDRSQMLARARRFFEERGVLEVDCPLITRQASVDAHIDLVAVIDNGSYRYLHSSPEYCMKRLLALGIGDIYQLGHVFRDGEYSPKHNPEFTMAEWYRLGMPFEMMMVETVDFIKAFLGELPYSIISYNEAFAKYTGIDYCHSSDDELIDYIKGRNLIPYDGIKEEGRDAILNLILGSFIEPMLGNGELTVLAYYPATQAALAKRLDRNGEMVAERFEIYYRGVELCNGYHELADPKEQRERLIEANTHRRLLGKEELPIDERFLEALEAGIPDACGVAVGFDRLMMLRHSAAALSQVLPFDWQTA